MPLIHKADITSQEYKKKKYKALSTGWSVSELGRVPHGNWENRGGTRCEVRWFSVTLTLWTTKTHPSIKLRDVCMSNKVESGSVAYLKLIILRKELDRNYPKNSTMKIALSQAGINIKYTNENDLESEKDWDNKRTDSQTVKQKFTWRHSSTNHQARHVIVK